MPEPIRLVPIPRVSVQGDRPDNALLSPDEQLDAMHREAVKVGITLLDPVKEINVSGTLDATDRPGIQATLEAIADGDADGCMFDNFDRGGRGKMAEVAGLVTAAGGRVYAIGQGWLEYDDPDKRLIYDILDAVGGHLPRKTRKNSARAKRAAILKGRSPKPTPAGYDKDADKLLRRNADAPAVLAAFEARAAGATLREVRALLAAAGVRRSFYGVQTLLRQTDYTGDLIVKHMGETLTVREAHDQIVPWELFDRVQALVTPRGRMPKSDYLLGGGLKRLEDHRGIRMVAGPGGGPGTRTPRHYRTATSMIEQGERLVTIGAHIVEPIVWAKAQEVARNFPGTASLRAEASKVEAKLADKTTLLAAKVAAMTAATSVAVVEAVTPQIEAAQIEVDELTAKAERLRAQADRLVLDPDDPSLDLDDRRDIIRVTIDRVVIVPASEATGAERVTVIPFQTA